MQTQIKPMGGAPQRTAPQVVEITSKGPLTAPLTRRMAARELWHSRGSENVARRYYRDNRLGSGISFSVLNMKPVCSKLPAAPPKAAALITAERHQQRHAHLGKKLHVIVLVAWAVFIEIGTGGKYIEGRNSDRQQRLFHTRLHMHTRPSIGFAKFVAFG